MRRSTFAPVSALLLAALSIAAVPAGRALAAEPTPAAQAAPCVGIEDAIRLAFERHPRLQASKQRLEAARGRARAWSGQPNPLVDVGVSVGGQNVGSRDEDLIVSQTLDLSQQRAARHQSAARALEAAESDYGAAANDLARDVRLAYIDAQTALGQQALAQEAHARAVRLRSAVNKRVEQGVAPQTAAMRAEVEALRASQALLAAGTELTVALVQLRLLTGVTIAPGALEPTIATGPVASTDDDLTARALRDRPELKSLRARVEAQVQEARAIGQSRFPDVVLAGRRARLFAAQADVGLRASLQFPLLDFGSIGGAQQEAEAMVGERQALLLAEEARVASEVMAAQERLAGTRRALSAYQSGVLARSQALERKAQTGYEAGVYNLFEVLDAQEALRSARTAQLSVNRDIARAEAELAWATGSYPPPPTAPPSPSPTPGTNR
jgi:outer membrane protein TolC